MSQDNTVSFKAYLLQGNTDKCEVRRFGIDRDVVSSFDYLKEKLQHVFPNLRNQNFSVGWKDADGDSVVISSDDELMIALAEMQNEVRKLYIKVLGSPAHSPNTGASQGYEDLRHRGVICDACDQQIEGFRYHCTDCFDYDLCSNCEAKKMHREHIMIRLPAPVPPHLLTPELARVMAHLEVLKGRHGNGYAHGYGHGYGYGYGHGHGHGRDRRHHHGRERWCHLDRTLGEMLGMNPDEAVHSADEHKQSHSAEKGKQNVSAEEIRGKMKTKYEKFAKARGKKAEYMWSVGQKIAEFLDPWGIDVDVRVLTGDENENKNEEEKKGEEKMETEETDKDEVQNKDPTCSVGEDSSEAGPSQAPEACGANTTAQTECTSPETDDWTVLNSVPADRQQKNHNAADLKDASASTSDSSSDDDQTSVIEVQLEELHMASDTDDVEEIYVAGPCARGRKRKSDAEWRKKHGCKKGDIGNLKKHGHKRSGSESRKKHGHKRSGSESRKKHGHKRSGSESRKKHGHKRNVSGNEMIPDHRSQQNSDNPPEPTAAATSANQVQNETEEPTPSTSAAPIQVGATSVNQAQSGAGEPSTSRIPHMFPGVGTPGMPSSGANAPYIGMPAGANGPIYGGLRAPGMPTSGTNVPMYTGLRTTGMPTSGTNAAIHAGSGGTVPSATGSYYTNIYPTIPNTNFHQFYLQALNQPRQGYGTYTRPHVADAVQKMMAMGFSNEGGWLTQLLEIKNGDIEKALDVLQPVKRS